MKHFPKNLLLLLLLAACFSVGEICHAALPPAPSQSVFDPGDIWSPEEEARLSELSNTLYKERKFRVYFVAIGAGDTDAPETVAEEFSRGWLQGAPGAVFISLLNRPGLGVSVGEGKQTRPSEDRITDARLYLWERRGDPNTAVSLGDAARGLVRDLKLFSAPAPIVTRTGDSETYSLPLNWPLIASIGGGIFFLILVSYMVRMAKQSNFFGHRFEFPVTQTESRFGGINSGGHGVMIDFKSPAPTRTRSRKSQDY